MTNTKPMGRTTVDQQKGPFKETQSVQMECKKKMTSHAPHTLEQAEKEKTIYFVEGRFVPSNDAVIPVDDLAVLRGVGVCDLMRTYKGKPFLLKEHVARLIHSAKAMELPIDRSETDIEEIIRETLKRNPAIGETQEANVRTIITGGSSPDFMTPLGCPRVLVLITPIPPIPSYWYEKGVKVITIPYQRALPQAKTLSYMPATLALKQARQLGAVEALYVNTDQIVTEGTTSNLFAFVEGKLITAEADVLKGITRQAILEVSRTMFEIELRSMPLNELCSAEEVFISGTNKGIVPVVRIDECTIGNGTPGLNTRKLIHALEERIG